MRRVLKRFYHKGRRRTWSEGEKDSPNCAHSGAEEELSSELRNINQINAEKDASLMVERSFKGGFSLRSLKTFHL